MLPFLRTDLTQTGGYVPNPGHEAIADAEVLDALDANESPFDLPPKVKRTLAERYQSSIQTNRYPDGTHDQLKAQILDYVQDSQQFPHTALQPCTVTPTLANVSVGNGSDELIRSLLIATCVPQCGSVLVADPTFSMYRILAESLGIPVISVGRDAAFQVDCEAASAAIAMPPAGYPPVRICFMVHPNSPTGNGLTTPEVEWLQSLPDNILVVIDEAYFEFSQRTLVTEALQRSNWVITRTFSKAFRLAAHRVGYAVGHPELIRVLEKLRLPYNLPTFSQAAAIATLEHRQEILADVYTLIRERERLSAVFSALPGIQCYPSEGNFLFLQFQPAQLPPALANDLDGLYNKVFTTLRSRGTLIRYTGGGLRITVGTSAMNQRTSDRLQSVLQELHIL